MPTIRKKRGNGSIIFFESRLILKDKPYSKQ